MALLRLGSANLTATKTFDLVQAGFANHPADEGAGPGSFSLLLRGQVALQPDTTAAVQTRGGRGKTSASTPASAPEESRAADERNEVSHQEAPAATGQESPQHASIPAAGHSRNPVNRSTASSEGVASPVEAGNAIAPDVPTSISARGASTRGTNNAAEGSGDRISTTPALVGASSIATANPMTTDPTPSAESAPVESRQEAAPPSHEKDASKKLTDAVRPDRAAVSQQSKRASAVEDPGRTITQIVQPESLIAVGPPHDVGAAGSPNRQAAPGGSPAVRKPLAGPIRPSASRESGEEIQADPELQAAASPASAGQRVVMHDQQAANIAAARQRTLSELRPAGGSIGSGQHARAVTETPPAQNAQFAAVPGLGGSAVSNHRTSASAGLSSGSTVAFERMDSAEPPHVLESSPQKLAVGIRDTGLGWIEVRAHSITGQISATLASGTNEAHSSITAELPAIRETLVNHHVALESLSAERFPSSSSNNGSASNPPDSGDPSRRALMKSKDDRPSVSNIAEGETVSYINVRV